MVRFRKSKKNKENVQADVEELDNKVILPNKVLEEVKVMDSQQAMIRVEGKKIFIEFLDSEEEKQSISLHWFLIPAMLVSVGFFFFFKDTQQISLVGENSISTISFFGGLVSGIASFLFFFIQGKKDKIKAASKNIYWRNLPTVLISFGIILAFFLILFFKVLELVFIGASFDIITATVIFFLIMCFVNYAMIYISIFITPSMLTNILTVVIIGGVFTAMMTNTDQEWWQYNFSFLGTPDANNSWQFNVTLIFSALLMIALIDYLFVTLQKAIPKSKRLAILRVLLTLTAINLGGVGLFPYNELWYFQRIHDYVARALVVLILILIVFLRWLLPNISKRFLRLSYLIGVGLAITVVLFLGLGYLSLTAFELIAFVLAFSWILLLLQNLQKLVLKIDRAFEVTIEGQKPKILLEEESEEL
ncbi:putative membrane protein [Breznakia sp. PF5-3]|uniref:DUF998 domain-containing protein n=1 Tax=unclassified Breznakia TaxID=2623764 RepID=UPI00240595E2|nr:MULTISPECIES: DUF998 domain-containing protein [unclassified Breznakia]MDL2276690.1 DUF998 domain-containing protein [Breznakia sp. OttesenSCG-928-G09]MDF9824034.1 putative membrane protein [Breznakia sp. PM6-1]MDF9834900.1 putative membrane protein [Breznakia sp. PF5-3]MDF9837078.1 putative membrane protein [Breznakia sp. PFB2-8]MDF9859003.1 putative membrane protein [Breznakia sp. PH5-24]